MVHSSMLAITTDGEHLTCGSCSLGETVHFESLRFTTNNFSSLSLTPKGSNPGAVFMGKDRKGSPSLCTMLEDITNEFYMASSGEGSFGLPVSQRCSIGAPPAPIETTPWPENASSPQTMMMVPAWTITPLSDTRLPPKRQHGFWEGQRARVHTQQDDVERKEVQW
jgi:hypothetical protein